MPSFGQLTLIIVAGLCGPLLSGSRRLTIPVVVGELLAGVALGKTGAGLIKANDPTIAFLGNIGFAVLMMVAGMHVPLRNRALLGSLRRGTMGVVASAVLGLGGGLLIAHLLGFGRPGTWAILLATASAAIVLPALDESDVEPDRALLAMAWATVADVSTIVAVPLVLNPSKALRAALGVVAVAAGAVVVLIVARTLANDKRVRGFRRQSGRKGWALDLRFALVALFALCALAQWSGVSIMIAGFSAGLVVAWEGGPRRLSDQVIGVGQGFLVPVFFVVLGASLDVRALVQSPKELLLVAALIVGMVAVHVLAGLVIRAPVWTALIVTAQLGVPVAIANLGLADGLLKPGEGAAIIVAALASLGVCAAGTAVAKRSSPARGDPAIASPPAPQAAWGTGRAR
jgi:Kef-type K+ transport system membrane component KefB